MDTGIGTFQADTKAAFTPKRGMVRPVDIISLERRKTDERIVTGLVETLRRDGGFLHSPAVRDEGEGRWRLITGGNRVEACKRHFGEEAPIPAIIYPAHTPDALITVLEIEENLLRKELTAAERQAQTIRLAAALKKLTGGMEVTPVSESGEAAERGYRVPPLSAGGGRGNKGVARELAEQEGVTKRAIKKRVKAASATIGEEIDLDRDSPEELDRKAADLEKADERQHAERKVVRLKRRKPAPGAVTEDATPAESQAGEIDGEIEEVWRAFSALSERKQTKIMLRACQLRGWALRIGRARRVPAVDEESELAENLRAEVPPATDDAAGAEAEERDDLAVTQSEEGDEAAVGQPEQGDAAHLSAEDLQDAGAGQEPELTMNLPPEDEPATDAAAVAQAEQEDAPDLGAADLQDAGVDTSEAADQELVDATKCAYCKEPFSSTDPSEMKYGRLYHRKECAKWAKPIAIAA